MNFNTDLLAVLTMLVIAGVVLLLPPAIYGWVLTALVFVILLTAFFFLGH